MSFGSDLAVMETKGFKLKKGLNGFPVYNTKGVSIDELNLGARASNGLKRAQVKTVDDLLEISSADLYKMRNMGVKSIREIKNAVLNWSYDHMNDRQREEFWKEVLNG